MLATEFDRSVLEHPEIAEQIPCDAVGSLQLEGEADFNWWARQLAESRQVEGLLCS